MDHLRKAKAYCNEKVKVLYSDQEKPNTYVRVEVAAIIDLRNSDAGCCKQYYIQGGWSKCKYPDIYDAAEGWRMAVRKACAVIARRIVADGWVGECECDV